MPDIEHEVKQAGDFIRATAPSTQTPESIESEVKAVEVELRKGAPTTKQPQADKPVEVEAPKPEDAPVEEEAEPEPLELEKALAAMRRAGFNEKQIGRLAKRDVLERGIALAKMQGDFDALKRDHETLKKAPKAVEKPDAEAKTPAPQPADFSKLSELLGEDVAPVVVQTIQEALKPLQEELQALRGRETDRVVGAARRELGVRYPQLLEQEVFDADIKPLAAQIEASGKFNTAEEILAAACRALGYEPTPEKKPAHEVAAETKTRLNGIPGTNGRQKSPTVSKSKDDIELEGMLALEAGDNAEAKRLFALSKTAQR